MRGFGSGLWEEGKGGRGWYCEIIWYLVSCSNYAYIYGMENIVPVYLASVSLIWVKDLRMGKGKRKGATCLYY